MSELKNTAPDKYYNVGWWDGFVASPIGIVDIPQQYMHHYDDGYHEGLRRHKEEQLLNLLEGKV